MPFEKVKQLARVAKTMAELPAGLIEMAKDPEQPAARLREEVDIMLYGGAPDHSDGPKRSLVLVGGMKVITDRRHAHQYPAWSFIVPELPVPITCPKVLCAGPVSPNCNDAWLQSSRVDDFQELLVD